MQARQERVAAGEHPQEHANNDERTQDAEVGNGAIGQADLALVTPGPPYGQTQEPLTGPSSGKRLSEQGVECWA